MASLFKAKTFRLAQAKPDKTANIPIKGLTLPSSLSTFNGVTSSAKYIATIVNGNTVCVLPIDQKERPKQPTPVIQINTTGEISDLTFSPHCDSTLAVATTDGKVYVFQIPEGGLTQNIPSSAAVVAFTSFSNVFSIRYHPTAKDLLAIAHKQGFTLVQATKTSADQTTNQLMLRTFNVSPGAEVSNFAWSFTGSYCCCLLKNNHICLFDPRIATVDVLTTTTTTTTTSVLPSMIKKAQQVLFVYNNNHNNNDNNHNNNHVEQEAVVVLGLSSFQKPLLLMYLLNSTTMQTTTTQQQQQPQQLVDWNKPILTKDLDFAQGATCMQFDADTGLLFVSVRGSSMLTILDMTWENGTSINNTNCAVLVSTFAHDEIIRGFCLMQKRAVNSFAAEIDRLFYLQTNNNNNMETAIQHITVSVPRKTSGYHDELYPRTRSTVAPLTVEEFWREKKNAKPHFIDFAELHMKRKEEKEQQQEAKQPSSSSSFAISASSPSNATVSTPTASASAPTPTTASQAKPLFAKKTAYYHLTGNEPTTKHDGCYDLKQQQANNLILSENVAADALFVAYTAKATGGSSVVVLPWTQKGRFANSATSSRLPQHWCVKGHSEQICSLDLMPRFDADELYQQLLDPTKPQEKKDNSIPRFSVLATADATGHVRLYHLGDEQSPSTRVIKIERQVAKLPSGKPSQNTTLTFNNDLEEADVAFTLSLCKEFGYRLQRVKFCSLVPFHLWVSVSNFEQNKHHLLLLDVSKQGQGKIVLSVGDAFSYASAPEARPGYSFPEPVLDWSLHPNSHIIAVSAKDGKVRLFALQTQNPQQSNLLASFVPPESLRDARVYFGLNDCLVVVGFQTGSRRSVSTFDCRDIVRAYDEGKQQSLVTAMKPCFTHEIDVNNSQLLARFEVETGLLLIANQGGNTIYLFQIHTTTETAETATGTTVTPYGSIEQLAQSFQSTNHTTAFVLLPKCVVDVASVEVLKSVKLTVNNEMYALSWTLPRKRKEFFQDDVFPSVRSSKPLVTTTSELLQVFNSRGGKKAELVSLKPASMIPLSQAPEEELTERQKKYQQQLQEEKERQERKVVGATGHTNAEQVKEHFRNLASKMSSFGNRFDAKQDDKDEVDEDEWDA